MVVQKFCIVVDKLSDWLLNLACWFLIALIFLTFEQVGARYVFAESSIAIQELQWHLFGAVFLLAAPAALKVDEHVRVDIFRGMMSRKQKNLVDCFGFLFFLTPFCIVLGYFGVLFCLSSLDYSVPGFFKMKGVEKLLYSTIFAGEGSVFPGGLPARWIIKVIIPVSSSVLFLQGLSNLLKQKGRSEGD